MPDPLVGPRPFVRVVVPDGGATDVAHTSSTSTTSSSTATSSSTSSSTPPPPAGHLPDVGDGSAVAQAKDGQAVPLPSSSSSTLLRAAQLSGAAPPGLAQRLDAARSAIDARVQRGFDPQYPIGTPLTGLVPIGGSAGVHMSGGANHALGSLLVYDPSTQAAHHIKHGFAEVYLRAQDKLGGRPTGDALGAPREEEREASPGHAVQRFEHGELHWTAQRGVWIEPDDLLTKRASSLPPAAPRSDVPVDDALRTLAADLKLVQRFAGKIGKALTQPDLELCAHDDTALPQRVRDACASLLPRLPPALLSSTAGIDAKALQRHAMSTWVVPLTYHGENHAEYFVEWARKQVAHNPAIKSVHDRLRALLESDQRPDRLAKLLDAARGYARDAIAGESRLVSDAERAHVVNLTALVAMAGHALKNDGSGVIKGFPVFMWDGRTVDAGMDKSWHFTNHAMMANVLLYDGKFGDGSIKATFEKAVDDTDKAGAAQRVARTYHERKGALGAYVGQCLDGPPDEDTPLYAPAPTGLSPDEQRAFDVAVRIGDAHEYKSSGGDAFTVALDDIGDTLKKWQPLADVYSRHGRVWGLQDHGVSRDLTANRLGARFGVELFRDPTTQPAFPYDEGKVSKNGAYAKDRPIPFAHWVADERTVVALLDGEKDPIGARRRLFAEAQALGKDKSVELAKREVLALVDKLIGNGNVDDLARLYGSFSVRHLRWGERLPGFAVDASYYNPDSTAHRDWARSCLQNGKAAEVRDGFASRLEQMAKAVV